MEDYMLCITVPHIMVIEFYHMYQSNLRNDYSIMRCHVHMLERL